VKNFFSQVKTESRAIMQKTHDHGQNALCKPNGCGQTDLCLKCPYPINDHHLKTKHNEHEQTLPYCAPASNITTLSVAAASVPLTLPDIAVNNYTKVTTLY